MIKELLSLLTYATSSGEPFSYFAIFVPSEATSGSFFFLPFTFAKKLSPAAYVHDIGKYTYLYTWNGFGP